MAVQTLTTIRLARARASRSRAAGGFVVLRAPMALGRVFISGNIAHHRENQSSA
jgi:hypothetical protein